MASFLVPAPHSAFEHLSTIDLRVPFEWASSWKTRWKPKSKVKARNEGKVASESKRKFSKLVSDWPTHRKKKGNDGAGPTVRKQGRGAVMQTKKRRHLATGLCKAGVMKHLLKSNCTTHQDSAPSSPKSDDSNLSFIKTFNPIDEGSSPDYAGFREDRSNFSFESSNQTRIGKWGSWNMDENFIAKGKVMARKKSHGFLKFMRWPVQLQFYSKVSASVCHNVASDLESLQLQQLYKEKASKVCTDQTEAQTFYGKKDNKLSKRKILTRSEGRKLGMKCSQKKLFSASNSGTGRNVEASASDLHIAHNCVKEDTQEELKSNKAADSAGSQFLKQLMHPFGGICKRSGSFKLSGHDEAVKGRATCAVQMTSSESANVCAKFAALTGRVGIRKLNPVATQSSNSYTFKDQIGSSIIHKPDALRSSFRKANLSCTRTGLTSANHGQRSAAVTLETGPAYSADLALLNAKMDMRFDQLLTAIDIVADRVKRNAQSQPQTCRMVDDEEESVRSRLMSSSTSDLGTIEMELSPFKKCVSRSQFAESPIVKEFKGALNHAHHKIRVLAGLLAVEKNTKTVSAGDFQFKRMICSMGMTGGQMLDSELLLEKPWHFKYLLDYCVSSIFFSGPHNSSRCICSRARSSPSSYNKSAIFDSFCNDIDFSATTFDSFCDEATQALEQLTGSMARDWSHPMINTFRSCTVCCFQVHKLTVMIRRCERTLQILHPSHETSFDASSMDPLDTGNFDVFHTKVLFTIFSGFMLEGKLLCKSEVYLEPKAPAIIL